MCFQGQSIFQRDEEGPGRDEEGLPQPARPTDEPEAAEGGRRGEEVRDHQVPPLRPARGAGLLRALRHRLLDHRRLPALRICQDMRLDTHTG